MWYVTKPVLFGKCLQRTVPTSMSTLLLFFFQASVAVDYDHPCHGYFTTATQFFAIAPVSVSERRIIVICNCKEIKQTVTLNMFVLLPLTRIWPCLYIPYLNWCHAMCVKLETKHLGLQLRWEPEQRDHICHTILCYPDSTYQAVPDGIMSYFVKLLLA